MQNNFISNNDNKALERIFQKKEDFWNKQKELRALKIFHQAAQHVPAYKDFLIKHKISPDKIRSFADFRYVPPTSKKNYLQKYPIEKLLWHGALNKNSQLTFTSTSGSTGNPFYFPRSSEINSQASLIHELFLKNITNDASKPTLVIVGFSMGVWIGGLITYRAFEIGSQINQQPISIITPGINKAEILKALKFLSPHYHQTIISAYPPFLKDIMDAAEEEGIPLKKLNLKLLMAAETFSENFRDYLKNKANLTNIYRDTMNIYGSADIGTMAFESPFSILTRRLALENKTFYKNLFGQNIKLPTLAQYHPGFICFESQNDEIILTGNNVLPLIRYAIGDYGGIHSYSDVINLAKQQNIDLPKQAQKLGLSSTVHSMPFVYVFERKDLSTTLYGLQIYPEIIREALLEDYPSRFITGKFNLSTKYDKQQNQFIEINLELKPNQKVNPKEKKQILKIITDNLLEKNGEFKELFNYLKNRALPKFVFWPYNHPQYFKTGGKQKWITHQ